MTGFARHRTRNQDNQVKQPATKKPEEKKTEEIPVELKIIVEEKEPEIILPEEEEKPQPIAEKKPAAKKAPEKKTPVKKEREDSRKPLSLGLIGDTIEARDFRAICKKKNLQINTELNKLLHEWNTANYNL